MVADKNKKKSLFHKLETGKDYYEIRLESIGGLGANLCGKMLGELGLKYLNLNSTSFSSYGSEKTGTPVKGFIRYCQSEREIRVHYPVFKPDLLVIFHQALIKDEAVWKGCSEDTKVILAVEAGQDENLVKTLSSMFNKTNIEEVYTIKAQKIAMETHSRINVVMLGAALKIMGVEDTGVGEKICEETLGKKYPDAMKNNIEGIRRGFKELEVLSCVNEEGSSIGKNSDIEKCQNGKENKISNNIKEETSGNTVQQKEVSNPHWGYDNAPIGGINPRFGSTVISDLSPSRQGYIPLFIKDRCINCGLCHTACPDMVFQFVKGEYKGKEMMVNQGLDYYHCKGCLRCVDVCPVNALVRGVESEHPVKEFFLPNQELIRTPDYYEESGPDGYITSESYLTEKRMEGGEV